MCWFKCLQEWLVRFAKVAKYCQPYRESYALTINPLLLKFMVIFLAVAVRAILHVPHILVAENFMYMGIAVLGALHALQISLPRLSEYMAAHVLV
jgi:hypothetical protein